MRIEASAPGKLVLLGEYAVLEGAPALVLAVDRRARVIVSPAAADAWEIVSPTLGLSRRLHLQPDRSSWDGEPAPALKWVATLLRQVPFGATFAACRVALDSDPLHLLSAGAPCKLGLGSSAALTVALLGALHRLAGQPAPGVEECVAAHRAIQHGRGSGIDIAASLAGGLLRVELDAGRVPRCHPIRLPAGLHWCCVYSGNPVSTEAMLAQVTAWRSAEPDACARRMRELATISTRGVDAARRDDAAAFLATLHEYATVLAALGAASGTDIASRGHRELAAIADAVGAVYKSCGAGGGDVGVTFAVDDETLREFKLRAVRAGFPVIEMQEDRVGLHIATPA